MILTHIFIDGLSGMAFGLFATLIVGTIICQIASLIGKNFVGDTLSAIGSVAKVLMGAGIGIGVAVKFKKSTLLVVSCAVAGMVGAYASKILSGGMFEGSVTTLVGVGEPLGAFISAYVAMSVGALVDGKTKIDILITPLVAILSGSVLGLLVGKPVLIMMTAIGDAINWGTVQQPFIMGIVVSALMGIALTLPISSAAIGISLGLTGLSAGAATVGCCTHMIGFAVMSFRENRWGGLIAQGIGTSMLQIGNLVKKPILWLPPIITSIILGGISTAVLGMTSNAVGSGMGTAGLVGVIMTVSTMTASGVNIWITLLEVAMMYFILPALMCLGISELMRKKGLIKFGDLKISL
ncbi:MAG: PTS sugar transporter subunit IIC [Clostridia bacterium]